ncbi:MAG: hypothetical protein ACRCYU_06600 [Nocardioides sp.]
MNHIDLTTLEAIRPKVAPLDAHWSATALESILATPVGKSRRSRKMRYSVAGLTTATLIGGGVAYATGIVPSFVTKAAKIGATGVGSPDDPPTMRLIVDQELPTGNASLDGSADPTALSATTSRSNRDGRQRPGGGGSGCGTYDPKNPERDLNRYAVTWAGGGEQGTFYPVLHGYTDQAGPRVEAATQVRVTGTLNLTGLSSDITIPIDPVTTGFSAVLPGTTRDPYPGKFDAKGNYLSDLKLARGLTLTFLDKQGRVTKAVHSTVGRASTDQVSEQHTPYSNRVGSVRHLVRYNC